MQFAGKHTGKALKVTLDTLLDQFKKASARIKPGEMNFALTFQLQSQSDEGTPAEIEGQLNSLVAASRCLSDNAVIEFHVGIQSIPGFEGPMVSETERLVAAQMAAIAAQEIKPVAPKLVGADGRKL